MSTSENDVYIENLQDRIADIIDYVRPGDMETFQRLVVEGDLEGARELVETLEAVYADDLR